MPEQAAGNSAAAGPRTMGSARADAHRRPFLRGDARFRITHSCARYRAAAAAGAGWCSPPVSYCAPDAELDSGPRRSRYPRLASSRRSPAPVADPRQTSGQAAMERGQPWSSRNAGTPRSVRPSCRCWPVPTSSSRPRICTARCGSSGSTIGLATVYRALQDMAGGGDLDTVRNQPARCCTGSACSRSTTTTWCAGSAAAPRRSRRRAWSAGPERSPPQYGYTDINHELELFGLCADCAAGKIAEPARPGDSTVRRDHGTRVASSGADRLSVQSTTAGRLPDLCLQGPQPDRQVGLGVVTGQVDVGDHVDLPRTDELQPQGGHPIDVGQVQQRRQRRRPRPRARPPARQELPVPVDQHDRHHPEQHPDQDRPDRVGRRRAGDLVQRPARRPRSPARSARRRPRRTPPAASGRRWPARARSGRGAAPWPRGRACRTDCRNEIPSSRNDTASTTYPMTKSLAGSGSTSSWMPCVIDTAAPATNRPSAANSDQT